MDMQIKLCRAESYRLLAACFYTPDDIWLNQGSLFKDLTGALQPVCPKAADFALQMGKTAAQYGVQELAIEYAKLFVGPYELLAPPYGSVYLDQGKRVMGDSTMTVIKMYQEYGLKIADDFKEMPDHIAVELEFMYYLIYKEIEAVQQAEHEEALSFIEAQQRFISSFLGKFVFSFCEKVKEGTTSEFYRALADCVLTFVNHDHKFLMEEKKRINRTMHYNVKQRGGR